MADVDCLLQDGSSLGALQPQQDVEWQRQHSPDTKVTLTQLPGQRLWGGATPDPFVFPLEQLLQPDQCPSRAFKTAFS